MSNSLNACSVLIVRTWVRFRILNYAAVFFCMHCLCFDRVLYKSTEQSVSITGQSLPELNRHVIVHMLENNFNNPANFSRIFLALTHITFIESLSNQAVPFLWSGYIDDSEVKALSTYIRTISRDVGEFRRNLLNCTGICKYGNSI